jgi:hypothetical protein
MVATWFVSDSRSAGFKLLEVVERVDPPPLRQGKLQLEAAICSYTVSI